MYDKYPWTQMRFYCWAPHPNRTIHIRTLNTNEGPLVTQYYISHTSTPPKACGSYEYYPDDDSLLNENPMKCKQLVLGKAGIFGDRTFNKDEIWEKFIYIDNFVYFKFNAADNSTDLCDSKENPTGQGIWKIYVR